MRSLFSFLRLLLIAVISLVFQSQVLAQNASNQPPGSTLTSAGVISKITTSPATTDALDNGKYTDPALVNDGAAYIYLTPAYRGKVDKVVYDITRLHPRFNPTRVSKAGEDRIVLQSLHRSEYQVKEIHLKDGRVLRIDSLQRPLFTVYTIDPAYAPLAGTAEDYTRNMEGNRVGAFHKAFASAQVATSALRARTDLPQPIGGGDALNRAGARMAAIPCGYYQVVSGNGGGHAPPCDPPAGSPNDGYGGITFVLQDCNGNKVFAYCYQHNNGGTAVGSLYQWDGNYFRPVTGTQQVLNDYCCTPSGSVSLSHPNCDQATGSATFDNANGQHPYYFSWDNGPWTIGSTSALTTRSGLAPGSHNVRVSYSSNGSCSHSVNFTINSLPVRPTAPGLTKTDPTCTTSTGTVSVTNPVGGYQYSFDGGAYATAISWNNLAAGSTHTVKARSASGCESAATSITIGTASGGISVAVTGNQQPCSSTPSTLTASVVGNPAGITYSWNSSSANGPQVGTSAILTVNPSVATTYFVTATVNGCSDTKSILVNAPRPAITLTNITTICKGSSTTITADNGGVAGYTYRWLGPASVTDQTTPVLPNQMPQTTTNYTVERTSAEGCKDTATSVVNVYEQPVIGTVTKTDAGCTGGNNGSITINASSPNNLELEYSIDGTTWQTSNVFTGLVPKAYSILVRNKNGICQAISGTSVTIGQIGEPDGEIQAPTAICATEPVQFQVTPTAPGATYSWSATGNPIITGGTTNGNLTAKWDQQGVYTATVIITLNGCTKTVSKSINITAPVVINAGADRAICKGGSTRIGTNAPAGSPSVTYSWLPTTGLDFPNSATPTATPAQTTVYTVTVTDLINGCTKTDDVEVKVDVSLNPRANAGLDQLVTPANPTVQLGTTQTSPNPWNGFAVDYLWTPISSGASVNDLDDETARITNFNLNLPTNLTTWTYQLAVRKQVSVATGNDGQSINHYCYAYDTVTITRPALIPDLTPVIYARPSTVYNTTPVTVVVDVAEVAGVASSGLITVRVTKTTKVALTFDPAATSIGGRPVQNSIWTLDNSNSSFYILTTTQSVGAKNKLSFGFTGTLTPGATTGTLTMTSAIVGGSGGEVRTNNNVDADKIDYFQQ